MSKRAPSTTQLLVITGFALSCFGILLFLWITFGGPTPFKAKSYEIKIPFNEAAQLAEQSDVRISGVNVGKVQNIELRPGGKQAIATVDIDDKYAPLPEGHAGDPADQDAARRDLRRTDPGRPQRPEAPGRRHPARGASRRIGPARRDLPHLRPEDPRRLPGLDAGSRGGDRGPGPEPLLRDRRTRTDLHRIRQALPRPRHPEARRPTSCSATAPPPSTPCAAAKASSPSLIRKLQRPLQHHGRPRPGHRSAVPRLPDLPGRVAPDARPPARLLRSTPTR